MGSQRETLFNSGDTLSHFRIEKELGAGGMGKVYLAKNTKLNRIVALKILPPEKADNPTLLKRFRAEAQAAAQLKHVNIVQVYDHDIAEDLNFIEMEYVEGIDVHRLVEMRGRVPVKRSIEIIKQVAKALDHASKAQIVHRDIKPSNLLITRDGTVKLADMGLARIMDETEETSITRAGTTVGTVDYMAPEQARSSKAADIRSDIYSLGCTWYHMLTGQPPFPEGSVTNKLQAHAVSKVPDPREINESVSPALVAILKQMMAKKPKDRYQTALELVEDIESTNLVRREISSSDLAGLSESADEIEEIEEVDPDQTSEFNSYDSDEVEQAPQKRRRTKRTEDSSPSNSQKKRRRTKDDESSKSSKRAVASRKSKRKTDSSDSTSSMPPRERKPIEASPSDRNLIVEYGKLIALIVGAGLLVMTGWSVVSAIINRPSETDPSASLVDPTPLETPQVQPIKADGPVEQPQDVSVKTQTQTLKASDARKFDELVIRSEVPAQIPQLPPEKEEQPKGPVRTVVVGQQASTPEALSSRTTHPADSLASALAKLPKTGGKIVLSGFGPHFIPMGQSLSGDGIRIEATGDQRPLILMTAQKGASNWFHLKGGRFEFEGLDFAIRSLDFPTPIVPSSSLTDRVPLFLIERGNVTLKQCSITIQEQGVNSWTLFHFPPGTSSRPSVRFYDSMARGVKTSGFESFCKTWSISLNNSLMACSTWLNINADPQNAPSAGSNIDLLKRNATLKNSTCICEHQLLKITHPAGWKAPIPLEVSLTDSNVLKAGDQPDNAPLIEVNSWPEDSLRKQQSSLLQSLRLTSHQFAQAGWKTLCQIQTNNTNLKQSITSAEQWQQTWGAPLDPKRLLSTTVSLLPTEYGYLHAGIASPRFDPLWLTLDRLSIGTRSDLSALPAPEIDNLRSIQKFSQQTHTDFASTSSLFNEQSPVVVVDLAKDSLQAKMNDIQNGIPTVIHLSGRGNQYIEPIQVRNKIICLQAEPESLHAFALRPKIGRTRNSKPPHAWLTLTGSHVELKNLIIATDDSRRGGHTEYLVQANDSHLRIAQTLIQSLHRDPSNSSRLIEFQVSSAAGETHTNQLVVEQSALLSQHSLFDLHAPSQFIKLNDSILSSGSQLFQLKLHETKSAQHKYQIHSRHCTFGIGQALLKLNGIAPVKQAFSPVEFSASESVFRLNPFGKSTPVLLETETDSDSLRNVVSWWDRNCGFETGLGFTNQNKTVNANWAEYQSGLWFESGHTLNPLVGKSELLLGQKRPAQQDQLTVDNFGLAKSASATTWGDESGLIGHPESLSIGSLSKAASAQAAPTVNSNNPSKPARPNF